MVYRPARLLTVAMVACALLDVLAAGAAPFDARVFMDTPEIKRGMRAVGRSVFAGATITQFNLEIIDVMPKANAGGDMILARVLDGPVVKRNSGIIGGMSGSPVYINGRLIGAIAYGWGFMREPICGITAIRNMLEAVDIITPPPARQGALPSPVGERWALSTPLVLHGQTYRTAAVVAPGAPVPAGALALRPVGPTLACSGFGPQSMARLQQSLKRFGLEPLATGAAQAKPVPVSLQPGSALGVRFMSGDFDITGIGTVTYRQGNTLIGFGHPMMQRGLVAMPLCTAWIHDFLPNMARSNKLGSGMTDVGTLQADTAWAVGGTVGPLPTLRPAEIEILDQTRNLRKKFRVKVLCEKGLTPELMASGVASALEASYNPGFEGMVSTHFEVVGAGGAKVARENHYYTAESPVPPALGEVMEVMKLLEDNRWEPQDIQSLSFRAELSRRDDTAFIEKVTTEESVAKAGKALHLKVQVRPDSGPAQEYPFTLDLPRDLPKGSLRVAVVGGGEALSYRSRLGVLLPDFDGLTPLLSFYEKLEDNRQLCVIAALPTNGLRVGVTALTRFPDSLGAIFEKSPRTDMDKGREEVTLREALPWVVFGREVISLPTEDRQGGKGTVTGAAKPAADSDKSSAEDKSVTGPAPAPLWWAASAFKPAEAPRAFPLAEATDNKPRPLDPADRIQPGRPVVKPPTGPPATNPITRTDEQEDKEEDEEAAKTVLRQPSLWTQAKASDFSGGEAKGTAPRSDGGLGLSPALTDLGTTSELYVMAVATAGQHSYVATASPGRIYRLTAEGKLALHFAPQAFGVRALVGDASGNLYAGTFPGGKVYRITPDGQGTLLCQLPAEYVWRLARDASGRLLAATGPTGKLFAIDAAGQVKELATVPQSHLLALLPVGDTVYFGTADRGLVYRLNAEQKLEALFDAGDQDVTSLAVDAQGRLHAGVAPEGKVVRLEADQPPVVVFEEKAKPVYDLALAGGRVYAATGHEGALLALVENQAHELAIDTESLQGVCLALTADGTLLGGLASPGRVVKLAPAAPHTGTFTSAVLDAGRPARWGVVDWLATVPAGGKLTVRTRSGNSNDPEDGSWSPWSEPYAKPGEDRLTSPVGRYLQYQLELAKAPGEGAPFLRRLCLCYLPANQKPEAKFDDLGAEKIVRNTLEIKWTASDPDKDQLRAVLEYRPVGGGEWQKIAELGPDKKSTKWDTARVADGRYDLRLTVSDEISNPGQGLTAQALVYSLPVDNTRPALTLSLVAAQEGKLVVQGTATDNLRVVEVAYKRGDEWYGVAARDGGYDSRSEEFSFAAPLVEGKVSVEVQVRDAAGNVVTQTVKWPRNGNGN